MIETICNYGGLMLGLLGIAATAYFARQYAEKKLPTFAVLTESKIARTKDVPGDIAVSYKGKAVERVTSTIVWFWNAGRKPIRREDLPPAQPLGFRLIDEERPIEILDTIVRKVTRSPIGFTAEKSVSNIVSVSFDFLDQNDGAAIEVFHTGSVETDVTFSGIILGSPKGMRKVKGFDFLRAFMIPYRRGRMWRRPPLSFRIIASAVITILFGGLIFSVWMSRLDITTTTELLKTNLHTYVVAQDLTAAVSAVESSAKYRMFNTVMPYVMSIVILLNLLVFYFTLWKAPLPFPTSLALDTPTSQRGLEKNKTEYMRPDSTDKKCQ